MLGVDDRFWQMGDRYLGGRPIRPGQMPKPNEREIVLNAPLADAIGGAVGDKVVVRLPRASDVPADGAAGGGA